MPPATPYAQFFTQPQQPRQRQYELLRAHFVEGAAIRAAAAELGYAATAAYSLVHHFKTDIDAGDTPAFFASPAPGPKSDRLKPQIRDIVIRLRARDYSSLDIMAALRAANQKASLSLIDQILGEEGLMPLARRTRQQRQHIQREIAEGRVPGLHVPVQKAPLRPAVADARKLDVNFDYPLPCAQAGIFIFLPLLARIGLDQIVERAGWPGSKMIPSVSHSLGLLALKLPGKERKSHIDDWSMDPAMGLFAGLNAMPKKQATTDYSYRLSPGHHDSFMSAWTRAVYPLLCPAGACEFALDAHAIAYRGRDDLMQTHYVPTQGKKVPSIISFFARAIHDPMLCYAKADLRREELPELPLRFADYWRQLTGKDPRWLYFDSRTTTYDILYRLHQRGIQFITVRRKGHAMIKRYTVDKTLPWKATTIATADRPHARIRYLDEIVKLPTYQYDIRQIAQQRTDSGAITFFLTNNCEQPAREILARYHQRNYVENEIGVNVDFFHVDRLSSHVALNVESDVLMTLAAHSVYRWLASQLKGCEKMGPKKLFRTFIDAPGQIRAEPNRICVEFERRAHNPILRQALEPMEPVPIPWLQNKTMAFHFK